MISYAHTRACVCVCDNIWLSHPRRCISDLLNQLRRLHLKQEMLKSGSTDRGGNCCTRPLINRQSYRQEVHHEFTVPAASEERRCCGSSIINQAFTTARAPRVTVSRCSSLITLHGCSRPRTDNNVALRDRARGGTVVTRLVTC